MTEDDHQHVWRLDDETGTWWCAKCDATSPEMPGPPITWDWRCVRCNSLLRLGTDPDTELPALVDARGEARCKQESIPGLRGLRNDHGWHFDVPIERRRSA